MSALAVVGLGLVAVEGATTCPSPAEVGERLRALLPDGGGAAPDRAALSDEEGALRVELIDAAGATVAARRLGRACTIGCGDLAAAAAATIAAWEAELRPSALPAPSLTTAPLPPLPGEVSFGVALAASDGSSPAFGGTVAGALAGRRWRGFAIVLHAVATSERDVALGPGHASFVRPHLGLGGRFRIALRRLRIDLHGPAPLVAFLWVRGSSYDPSLAAGGADVGVGFGVRLSAGVGAVALFVGFSGALWLPQRAEILVGSAHTQELAALPVAEALFALGFSYGSAR